jgi:ATP-dependent RNA helicase RhlE
MGFTKLHLSSPLTRVLERQGYSSPTPIQEKAIPVVLSGKDVMGLAQTGTGKTAAFALPILERLMKSLPDKTERGHRHARVLVLAPTRELATQIGESFATYGVETGLSHTTIFGGVSQFHQVRAIQHGVDILIATPGRLIDLMEQRLVSLHHIEVFVLDEADRMLDMGFIAPIRRIAAATPAKRQTLMFSATMDKEVNKLAQSLLREPVLVEVPRMGVASEQVEQLLYFVMQHEKQAFLTHLLNDPQMERVVVFTKTKHGAERVGKKLGRSGINAETIHGNKAQNARTRALDRFRSGKSRVLVATDVAARGLDVDGITHVINMDLPMEADAYVHRIGRTGRAGATGKSISFCDQSERGLLRDIEKLLKKNIPTAPLPEFSRIVEDVAPSYEDRERRDQYRDAPQRKGPPRDKPAARGSHGLRRPAGAAPRSLRENWGGADQHNTRDDRAPARDDRASRDDRPQREPAREFASTPPARRESRSDANVLRGPAHKPAPRETSRESSRDGRSDRPFPNDNRRDDRRETSGYGSRDQSARPSYAPEGSGNKPPFNRNAPRQSNYEFEGIPERQGGGVRKVNAPARSDARPSYGKPAGGKPAYGKPASSKPAFRKSGFGKPSFGKPSFGKPSAGKGGSSRKPTRGS